MSRDDQKFKPYIPAEKITPEFTATSVIMGIILATVFGGANAYLGLRVGTTVSASIPAAVISMGVIRLILKRDSLLENNMVQTVGSAGESLAAGTIFTIPALFLWAKEGVTEAPDMLMISLIALFGGLLGVFFMIPLRNALIVKEHGTLPYPEGTACADVLLAGEEGGVNAKTVFIGMGIAAVLKFIVDGIKIAPGVLTAKLDALKTEFSLEVYPALVGVGYICGVKIDSYMLAGGIMGWFVLIPAIVLFGGNTVIYPGTETIAQIYEENGASAIWSLYIRYIGAGMVAAGGIISLIKSLPLIFSTFVNALKGLKDSEAEGKLRTERDLNPRIVMIAIAVLILGIWLLPQIPVSFVGAVIVVLFGFFFATVSSRMVGLVGNTNNPISGMTIATLLFATFILKAFGNTGASGMVGAISIGSIICIVTAMSADTSQDLKTGFLLGATPVKQQVGELIGTAVSAFTIGGVLLLLDKAWGFGTVELAAPQATLMKMIVEGVMEGNLPWMLIFIGVFIAVAVEIMGIPGLPVAEVAAAKGYGCKIAVQPGTSEERVKLVQAYGAETFEPYIGKDVMESLADVDRVAAETPGGWVPTQFHNLNNGGAHYATTGPEIYRDTDGKVDIYVAGVGTGGTASGTSEFLKKVKPEIYTVAVQPSPESVATPEKSVEEMTGIHKFTEIDPSFVPGNVHIDAFDEIYDVQTEEALSALQELARTEGVLMGYSGGAALYAAIKLARRPENKDKLIVFIVPDNGERYLSQDIYSKRSSQDRVVL